MTFLGSTTKISNKKEAKPNVRTVETQKVAFKNLTLEVKGNGGNRIAKNTSIDFRSNR